MPRQRSIRCVHECRPPFSLYGQPCANCADRYDRWMDESYELYQLAKEARQIDQITPATDQERLAFLDQVAPVVTHSDPFTFIALT